MKNNRYILLSLAFIALAVNYVKAQLPSYNTRIKLLYQQINNKLRDSTEGLYYETSDKAKNENKHSYLWPLCAYIQAANEMEVIDPSKDYMQPVEKAIDQYYTDKLPFAGYQASVTKEKPDSRFYDDNQWVAIAYLDAYNRNHKKRYLEKSEMICRYMLGGLDTVAGGGFYWNEGDKSSKNTCSNGPGILVLLQLYNITHNKAYLNTALDVYKWVNKTLQAPDSIYYDNIRLRDLKIGKAKITYNLGTMLQSNVLLYHITKDHKYLGVAEGIAKAGRKYFFKKGRLPGGYWFNAVMLRGYQELYKVDGNKDWVNFYQEDADAIWNTERDANNMLGTKPERSLIDQAAMIEIYARLQELK
ncbi:glycoside hydrolase family 76 protein [Mucilaginibacter sp.]|uniref:glycoside hydrolase family 76 protein n=1 Tax=Mucilaginibacter sp. TaxID=1882438 RepID=UPI003D12CF58